MPENKKIRILYVHGYAHLYGAEKLLLRLIEGLDKTRFVPFVILPHEGLLFEKLKKSGVACLRFPISVLNRFSGPVSAFGFFAWILPSIIFLASVIKSRRIDIVHTWSSHVVVAGVAAKLSGVKHIWHIQEINIAPRAVNVPLSYLIGVFSNVILAVSHATKDALELPRRYAHKIRVLYNGVPLEKEIVPKGCPKVDAQVGLIARITRWKGHEVFLRAAAIVLKNKPDVRFLFAGDSDTPRNLLYKNELKKMTRTLGIENRVDFLGYCDDMRSLYSRLDICVIPSIEPDPFPSVALEAMAAGKLIIASRVGGLPEILNEECARLMPPNDPERLAGDVISILNNPGEFERLSKNARRRAAEHFDIRQCVEKITAVYEDVGGRDK